MCSGFLDTGLGTIHNPTLFGSVEFGEMCLQTGVGCPATGTPKVPVIVGYRGSGRKKRSSNLVTYRSLLHRSIKDRQRSLPASSISICPAIGPITQATIDGIPVTGSLSLRAGSGFLPAMSGLLVAVSISLAIGTTKFKIAAPASLRCSSLSRFTWRQTTAIARRLRSV